MLGEACEKKMGGEGAAKVSVLKDLLKRMYKLMTAEKAKKADDSEAGEEMAEKDDDYMEEEVLEMKPKRKPVVALASMSVSTKSPASKAAAKGKKHG